MESGLPGQPGHRAASFAKEADLGSVTTRHQITVEQIAVVFPKK